MNNPTEDQQPPTIMDIQARNVWASNLEDEFKLLRILIWKFPYVAIDTEFPGVIAKPIGNFKDAAHFQYQMLKANINLLSLIQLGLSLSDEKGNMPPSTHCIWQFNFKFDLEVDSYAEPSIKLLQEAGLEFEKHNTDGIDPLEFAQLVITSGMILTDEVTWIAFHGAYDFGYLLRMLLNTNLPDDDDEFFELLHIYFPRIFDVKFISFIKSDVMRGGLQQHADSFDVMRVGASHQAGSDAHLTALTFFKMKEKCFPQQFDETMYNGQLYGLGISAYPYYDATVKKAKNRKVRKSKSKRNLTTFSEPE